eukprot:s2335_g12.t1
MLKPALLTSSATFKPNRVAPSLLEAEESDWRLVGTGRNVSSATSCTPVQRLMLITASPLPGGEVSRILDRKDGLAPFALQGNRL